MIQRKTETKTKPNTSGAESATSKAKAIDKVTPKSIKSPARSRSEPKKYQYYRGNAAGSNFAIKNTKKSKGKSRKPIYKISKPQIAIVALVCIFIVGSVLVSKLWREWNNSKSTETTKEDKVSELKKSVDLSDTDYATSGQQLFESTQNIIGNSDFNVSTTIRLNVPVYTQTYGQSCEASSLRMALEYRGIKTTDMELLNRMGYDGQPAEMVKGQMVWGNPHKKFVGDKDGSQVEHTGYGVFAEPIASAAKELGRNSEVRDNVETGWIAGQIYAGNPVVLWGTSVKIADSSWKTSDGEIIIAPMRTHTRLVIGFRGNPKNPEGFYLNDPALGKLKYWSTKDLRADIQKGTKQAVAIY